MPGRYASDVYTYRFAPKEPMCLYRRTPIEILRIRARG